jgi:quinol monooxygenase YgiN
MHPGMRDVLIELFDREFVETQESVGMKVIGQFHDTDDPDRFVWLRGFSDMPARGQALEAFYGGPVWKAHRDAANATIVDSDNVLLLRPARSTSGFSLENGERANDVRKGLVVATIYYLNAPIAGDFVDFFERDLQPVLKEAGGSMSAYFVTENSANNFPRLPVREGEDVFVWFSCFSDRAAYERHVVTVAQRCRGEISEELASRLKAPPEVLKLSPTARSRLHG